MFCFRCVPRECEAHPSSPEGFKVVAEKADDCCYSYRIVKEDCDVSACSTSAPICNYYEDLQFFASDENQCCGTYECACNPTKCHTINQPCPPGTARAVMDNSVCCSLSKCVADISADAQNEVSAMLLGAGFSAFVSGGSSANKRLEAYLSGESKTDAEAQSSSTSDVAVKAGSGSGVSTITTLMGDLLGGASSSGSGHSLASDYGTYAIGRYNALAESYSKALASASMGTIEGCCPGVVDNSACPSSCPSDQVCDGQQCVYPKDCPCIRNAVRRAVSAF